MTYANGAVVPFNPALHANYAAPYAHGYSAYAPYAYANHAYGLYGRKVSYILSRPLISCILFFGIGQERKKSIQRLYYVTMNFFTAKG